MAQKIIVEGENDIHAITNLCMKRKMQAPKGYKSTRKYEKEFVEIGKSKVELLQKIPLILKEEGLQNFGIVIDADSNFQKTWNEVKQILSNAAIENLPNDFPKKGLIIATENQLKIGVWIMPNNTDAGYLEYFLQELIADDDNLLPYINNTIDDLFEKKLNRFSEIRRQKATMQTWLSWQKEPGHPFGTAILKSYFDINKPLANDFINWMESVFEF